MYCPHCGNEMAQGQPFCPHCGKRAGEPVSLTEGREAPPWENQDEHGVIGGMLKTFRSIIFSPTEFFRKMTVTGGLVPPLLYGLILGMIGAMFQYFWRIVLRGSLESLLPPEIPGGAFDVVSTGGIVFMAFAFPFFIMFWLFLISGVVHVFLMLVKGSNAGFEATFRVVCYSESPYILSVLPLCGWFVAWIWSMVLIIIGLKEAHRTAGGKAAFAALVPLALCVMGGMLFMLLFMGVVAASIGAMM